MVVDIEHEFVDLPGRGFGIVVDVETGDELGRVEVDFDLIGLLGM